MQVAKTSKQLLGNIFEIKNLKLLV